MKIDLFDCENIFGLIINCDSGVKYTNQTYGFMCHHPEIEGVYIPLDRYKYLIEYIEEIGINLRGITSKQADELNELFATHFEDFVIKVDRDRLKESGEAWIRIIFEEQKEDDLYLFKGFSKEGWYKGVITWENSD